MGPPRGMRQEAGDVSLLEPAQLRPVELLLDANGYHFHPPGMVSAGIGQETCFGCSESHREVCGEDRFGDPAGIRIHAAGQVARDHKARGARLGAGLVDGLDQAGGTPPQPTLGTGSQHRINDDVGACRFCCQLAECRLSKVTDPPACAFKSSRCLGMG